MFQQTVRNLDRISGTALAALLLFALLAVPATGAAQQVPTILFSAGAYGTTAFIGNIVKVAKTAPIGVGPGCGTAKVGALATGTVASLNALPLVSTGVVNTSAATAAGMATGSSDVYGLTMLAGLITATEVKSVSTTSVDNMGNLSSSAAGSVFVNLDVAGNIINGLPAPNTEIDIANFGKVVLNEQITSSQSSSLHFTVNMIHLYITLPNVLNIKVGTQVIISDATSGIAEIGGPAAVDGTAFGTSVSGHLITSSPTAPVSVGCNGTNGNTITNTLVGVTIPNILSSGTVQDTAEADVTPTAVNSQTSDTIQNVNLLSQLVSASVIQAQASAQTNDGITFNFSDSTNFVGLVVSGHPEINDNVPANTQVNIANLGTLYLRHIVKSKTQITVTMIELKVNQVNVFNLPIGADIKIGVAEASLHSVTHP